MNTTDTTDTTADTANPAAATTAAADPERPCKVAVVTGATGGMGVEIVADLLRDHDVWAIGRDADGLDRLGALAHVTAVQADLVTELLDEPTGALDEVLGLERVDILVHAAAVARRRTVEAASAEEWRTHLDLNVVVPAQLTRRLLPALRQAGGDVVFINSGAGDGAFPGNIVYAASKHALRALADGLRKEEAPAGVRVSTVAPGPTDTPMLETLVAQEGGTYTVEHYIDPDEVARAVRTAVDAGPSTQITEIAVRPRVELTDR